MSITLHIEDYFQDFSDEISRLSDKGILTATRQSMNVTITSTRAMALKRIKATKLNLKVKLMKDKYSWLTKAKGKSIHTLEARIDFSERSIPLLEFAKNKKAISQKGIPIRSRKPLSVKVGRKTIKLKRAFVGKVKQTQVFRRPGDGTRRLKMQAIKSLAVIASRKAFDSEMKWEMEKKFSKEMSRNLSNQLRRLERVR